MAYIDQSDLIGNIGAARVDQLFAADGSGTADPAQVEVVCEQASAFFDTCGLEGWGREQLLELAKDPLIRRNIAWVALYYGAQGKSEWRNADGVAQYRVEYQDAVKHFERLAKGALRSRAEAMAGKHPIIGGRQILPQGQMATYIFAPDPNRGNPGGAGGF